MSAHQPARLAAGACRPAFRRRQHSGHTPLKLASPAWKRSASMSSRVFGGGDRYATGMPGYGLDPRMVRPSAISWTPVR